MLMTRIGEQIPDVCLEAFRGDDFETLRLRDRRGRWLVLLFYPADFTFVCPTELAAMAEQQGRLDELETDVVSISTDTVYAHKAWHDSSPLVSRIVFPMGADPTGEVSRAFGAYDEHTGLAIRATVLVDPDGVVRAIEQHDDSIGREPQEIVRKLQAAAFVRAHGEIACPAGWTPGGAVLTPGPDLVGQL
jgi:peroxiredoxin (alkyl hydroperoxide reductase subunit C)